MSIPFKRGVLTYNPDSSTKKRGAGITRFAHALAAAATGSGHPLELLAWPLDSTGDAESLGVALYLAGRRLEGDPAPEFSFAQIGKLGPRA